MSVSALFGTRVTIPSASSLPYLSKSTPLTTGGANGGGLMIECSSRPQKKSTAHHMKTRPRKSQPWDVRRKPTVYAPLPPLPPDWTLLSSSADDGGAAVEAEAAVSSG